MQPQKAFYFILLKYIVAMPEKVELLSEEKITFEHICDLKEAYKHAHDWLEWRKFGIEERKYKEKWKGKGRDLEIKWTASREFDEYSKIEFDIKWETINLEDVEVMVEGEKKKMNKEKLQLLSAFT
jgi:hypothetical protein